MAFRRTVAQPKPEYARLGDARVTVLKRGKRKSTIRNQYGYVVDVPNKELAVWEDARS
jgi:hypothetical protein